MSHQANDIITDYIMDNNPIHCDTCECADPYQHTCNDCDCELTGKECKEYGGLCYDCMESLHSFS